MRRLSFAAWILVAAVAVALPLSVQAGSTPTQTKAVNRPYSEVLLAAQSDPKAVAIVQKLLAKNLAELKKMNNRDAFISATFIQLGPDKPKNTIAALIDHSGVCGLSGCRTVILMSGEGNKYRLVFDHPLSRLFLNTRAGHEYTDIMAYVGRDAAGFGVHFWNEKKRVYEFAGVSKFKK